MNLQERLSQIAEDAVVADEEYVKYIYKCIVDSLESAAKQGLLSDNLDVEALRYRCATNPNNEFEGPRAVAWSDGLSKALSLIADEGVKVNQEQSSYDEYLGSAGRVEVDWSAL